MAGDSSAKRDLECWVDALSLGVKKLPFDFAVAAQRYYEVEWAATHPYGIPPVEERHRIDHFRHDFTDYDAIMEALRCVGKTFKSELRLRLHERIARVYKKRVKQRSQESGGLL